jgi:hypothetical protein
MRSLDRAWLATPLLTAFAVLRVGPASPGEYSMTDLAITLIATVAVAGVIAASVHFGAAKLGGARRSVCAVDLLLAAMTALFFWGVPLVLLLRDVSGLAVSPRYTVIVAFVATAATIGFAWRRGSTFIAAARFIITASVLLVGGSCIQLLIHQLYLHRRVSRSPMIAAVMEPVPTNAPPASAASVRPDIYVLVLDARANAATLREHFGYDDSAFTDSLRALGFVLPARFHSNYVHTALSLPSLLNFRHVDGIRADEGKFGRSAVAQALVEKNRSAALLKAHGYRYYLFPSEWYGLTERSSLADRTFHAIPFWSWRQVLGTEFRQALFTGTPVMLLPWLGDPTRHARATFDGLKAVPNDSAPTFVLAHFLLPHTPYVFGADCHPDEQPDPGDDSGLEKRLYIRQVRCTNDLVLETVTEILARSESPPVIAIVADHGSRVMPFTFDVPIQGRVPALEERFGAFGAFLTPGAPDDLFAAELTLVNVMQRLLVTYFGAEIPPSEDRYFAAEEATPFEIREIPAEVATGRALNGDSGPVDFP